MYNKQASLLILAAGMGSRYGGLKQLDQFGPQGETIIDYSIHDAIQAGFKKIIFVIRESFYEAFKERMDSRWLGRIEMVYAFQDLKDLPDPFLCPEDREKPWGTGHAVWAARQVIQEPFGIINADDYYGREALKSLYSYLENNQKDKDYAVIAYMLNNTLSEHGAVNRGVCMSDAEGFLEQVEECKGIQRNAEGEIYFERNEICCCLEKDTLVSMNMWAFQSSYFDWAEDYFRNFLSENINKAGSEFYIPELIQHHINNHGLKVKIIPSTSSWFGVTYKEDKPYVQAAIQKMIDSGFYPQEL